MREAIRAILAQGCGALPIRSAHGEYTRVFLPKPRLILLGGGHLSAALCPLASTLDFSVTVVDDRLSFVSAARFPAAQQTVCDGFAQAIRALAVTPRDYVAILTRGHTHDMDCIRVLLGQNEPLYTGLVGSRRRTAAMFRLLEQEGFPRERLHAIHTPIGIRIQANTPAEIAVSILAELIDVRNTQPKADYPNPLMLTDIPHRLLAASAVSGRAAVLATVLETEGSTPVETGAMMLVFETGEIIGTIGGGCGEHEIVMESMNVLAQGQPQWVTLSMDNDVAGGEGMVCGGRMSVWLERL